MSATGPLLRANASLLSAMFRLGSLLAIAAIAVASVAAGSGPAVADEAIPAKDCWVTGCVAPIPDPIWSRMRGRSWHAKMACPARESLAYLRVPYWNFEGQPALGELIVAKSVAREVADAFAKIYLSRKFRIASMRLIDDFDGNDDKSMAANNTSAFNCRTVNKGKKLSEHAFGKAIDINPVQNPYVRGSLVAPPAGKAFDSASERNPPSQGVIVKGDIVTESFAAISWKWGGEWKSSKDYQHFSLTGR